MPIVIIDSSEIGFTIDAAVTETHDLTSATTEHPVEEGADVTDHVRVLPDMLSIAGLVSNTPISLREGDVVSSLPSDDAFAFLKDVRAKREPVRIETLIATYRNMVMTNLAVSQNSRDALQFRATFRELLIVRTDRTEIPVEVPRAQKKSRRGTKVSKTSKDSFALATAKQAQKLLLASFGSI